MWCIPHEDHIDHNSSNSDLCRVPWPGTEGFVLSCSAQSMVKDFEQSHLIPPKMQTKLEISRQAELFPSSGFFQPRKVVLFCAIVRVAAE